MAFVWRSCISFFFFFSSRRRHTRSTRDWSSDVCSSDLGLRSGGWLTATRARGYSLILLGICAITMAGWIALSDGLIDRNGKPIGTDFSNVYAAGSLVLDGRPGDVYNMAAHYAREQ